MRFIFVAALLLALFPFKSHAFKWDKCKNVYKSWGVTQSQSKDIGGILLDYLAQMTTQATFQTSTSTTSFVSSTGDCRAFALAEEERFHYIAETHTELQMESANGQGEHLNSLASLYGCKPDSQPEFAAMLKNKHTEIFSSRESNPVSVTERITDNVLKSESLRKNCDLEQI